MNSNWITSVIRQNTNSSPMSNQIDEYQRLLGNAFADNGGIYPERCKVGADKLVPHSNAWFSRTLSESNSTWSTLAQLRSELECRRKSAFAEDCLRENCVSARVGKYENLVSLDVADTEKPHWPVEAVVNYGCKTQSYKAVCMENRKAYYLKRFYGIGVPVEKINEILETWKSVEHANIVPLVDAFNTGDFGDESFVMVYEYCLGAKSFADHHFTLDAVIQGWANPFNVNFPSRPFSAEHNDLYCQNIIPEVVIWDYIIQLSSILLRIHSLNLSCRIMKPKRILWDCVAVDKSRLRLCGIGMLDMIQYSSYSSTVRDIFHQQHEDIVDLGRIVLLLCCNSIASCKKENLTKSAEFIQRHYSPDIYHLIRTATSPKICAVVSDIIPIIGPRVYYQIERMYRHIEIIENEVIKHMHLSRALHVLCQLNMILDDVRNRNFSSSETGDTYMLKLFRDYMFHSSDRAGNPVFSMNHVLRCLTLFDAGDSKEKIILSPSTNANCVFIVTFQELKFIFDRSLQALAQEQQV